MSKNCMRVIVCMICLLSALFSGCAKIDVGAVDGGGMVNTEGMLMGATDGTWTSEDGRWSMAVDSLTLRFSLDGESVLESGSDFLSDGEDPTVHSDFVLLNSELRRADTEFAKVDTLYYENTAFTAVITYTDGKQETIVFTRDE